MQIADKSGRLLAGLVLTMSLTSGAHSADRLTVFDLKLGTLAAEMPEGQFEGLSCGSDGGPTMGSIAGWTAFAECPQDAEGLYEISFTYDDEAEMEARAEDRPSDAWGLGTSVEHFPVVLSALFNAQGRLEGLRIISDARYDPAHETFLHLRPRAEHYLLGLYLMDRFGMTEADCFDLPPDVGETPVLGMFEKRSCELVHDRFRYSIETRLLRRPGETDIDPVMGTLTEGQFVSETRAEVRLVNPE